MHFIYPTATAKALGSWSNGRWNMNQSGSIADACHQSIKLPCQSILSRACIRQTYFLVGNFEDREHRDRPALGILQGLGPVLIGPTVLLRPFMPAHLR